MGQQKRRWIKILVEMIFSNLDASNKILNKFLNPLIQLEFLIFNSFNHSMVFDKSEQFA